MLHFLGSHGGNNHDKKRTAADAAAAAAAAATTISIVPRSPAKLTNSCSLNSHSFKTRAPLLRSSSTVPKWLLELLV